jgi:hypothetical protein
LVTVFDPLALLLIFAGIHAFEIEKHKFTKKPEQTIEIKNIPIKEEFFKTKQEEEKQDAIPKIDPRFAELTKEDIDRLLAFLGKKIEQPKIELEEDFFEDEIILLPEEEEIELQQEEVKPEEPKEEIIEEPKEESTAPLRRWLKKKLKKKKLKRKPLPSVETIVEETKEPEIVEEVVEQPKNKNKKVYALEDGEEEIILHTNNSKEDEENISIKEKELKNINYHN